MFAFKKLCVLTASDIQNKTQVPLLLEIRLGYSRKVVSYSVRLKLQGLEKRSHQVKQGFKYMLTFFPQASFASACHTN